MYRPRSFVDDLATYLSVATGTTWGVLRTKAPSGKSYRYSLVAQKRHGSQIFQHVFARDKNVGEMKMLIATLLDMINMGFIPAREEKNRE